MSVVHESTPRRYMVQRREVSGYKDSWRDERAFGSLPEAVDRADYLASLFPASRYRVVDGANAAVRESLADWTATDNRDALNQHNALVASVAGVMALHRQDGRGYCTHCVRHAQPLSLMPYPCPTIRILDGEPTS